MKLWGDTCAMLCQLFPSPKARNAELKELAQVESPGEDDLKKACELLVTANHLRYFLSRVVSPAWLDLLAEKLNPPNSNEAWAGFSAVERLGPSHPEEVIVWLEQMYTKYKADPVQTWYVARAALDLGGAAALDLILRAIREHQHKRALLMLGLLAVVSTEPTDELVVKFADVLLNEASWERLLYREPLLEQFVEGTNAENARSRIELLCFKLRSVSSDDLALRRLDLNLAGSIGDREFDQYRDDRFAAMLGCLISVLRKAWGEVPAVELLELIEGLAEPLQSRLRPWILAHALTVNEMLMIEEIERAITTRDPTGDDILLLDRIVEVCAPADYLLRWSDVFGGPPSVEQLGIALGADEVPQAWRRASAWLSVLPEQVAEEWTTTREVLSAVYGRMSRSALLHRAHAETETGRSPFSSEELLEREPGDAARLISEWRPAPGDIFGGFWELARTLEAVVEADPVRWASNPVSIATKLRYPIYITHYIRALSSLTADIDIPVDKVLDLVHLVTVHPWHAEHLSHNDFDHEEGWRGADRAAVDLLKALADADIDFGYRADSVWALLETQVLQKFEPSVLSSDHELDPLDRAINRPCTRALQAVVSFMANEFKQGRSVRREAVELIEATLRLDGHDGAEHRAILAPRLSFLRHVLPEWADANSSLLFGDEAPDRLGQLTVDQAIKWGNPNAWLLENFRKQVQDSVVRKVDRALEHYLVAMLWECDGYSVAQVVNFMKSKNLVSEAAETLGRMLRHEDTDSHHIDLAVKFWQKNITRRSGTSLRGFGLFSEIGCLDDRLWAKLTLRTLKASGGRINWAHRIAERVVTASPTETGLEILNLLVRNSVNEWELRGLLDHASEYITTAQELVYTDEYRRLQTALLERNAGDN